jgi:hypothetical protein
MNLGRTGGATARQAYVRNGMTSVVSKLSSYEDVPSVGFHALAAELRRSHVV